MASFLRSDLEFILQQILISEAHAAGADLSSLIPNSFLPFGLRTVDGSFNNLVPGQSEFGAADNNFLQLLEPNFINEGDDSFGPVTNNNYAATNLAGTATISVADADPRIISNLVVDQTVTNPVAYETAYDAGADGIFAYAATAGADGLLGTADDGLGANGVVGGGDDTDDVLKDGASIINGFRADGSPFQTFQFANVTPDEGLSAGFNEWFVFFGQFFDHGLDLVNKGGNGAVFMPLMPDDPLYVIGSPTNFMVLTRATNTAIHAGADGFLGTSDDVHFQNNQTTPFVDQNQTYTSHPSHQVFLREYVLVAGRPVATGNLLDGVGGGLPTWAQIKAQAQAMLGIALDDQDILNLPLLATDAYGKFIPHPVTGFAQIVTTGGTLSGTPGAPVDASLAIRTNHAFLDDIAHAANPAGKVADADSVINTGPLPAGQYDNELLDAHFITGDGRGNENIGLTTVHFVFHAEHNRLAQHTKQVLVDDAQALLAGGATQAASVAFLNQWLRVDVATVPTDAQIPTLGWDGERVFQAARFGTEMQYQHLVFEEFARKIQPNVDAFLAPTGYDATINPAIFAEFAHVVYRFGHSMLTETIDRFNPDFTVASPIGLIQAFLNPLEFLASGPTPAMAAGAIVRGMTRQAGNEIDEFVTEALRNNLVGLPLDLPAINMARGRDTGVPSLNLARAEFFAMTGDTQLKPYTSWVDFAANLKHEASVINFIAAYGTHASITGATTTADKRAAAMDLVLGGLGAPADSLDFLNATGAYAGGSLGGLNDIDLWVGGLAERQMPFGGLLGSTFNFVFETQMENLQNGDRFYYLSRLAGLPFIAELENNTFANLIMLNTDATHLPADVFSTPTWILEVDPSKQFTGLGVSLRDDPTGGTALIPLVIRDNPATPGADTNYLQYTGVDHVVLGGTAGNDIIVSSIGDDTLYGDAGNDRLEGGDGVDNFFGGDGDDIITDLGGDDVIRGEAGNDVIHGGNGLNLIMGGAGNDFIVTGEDVSETFGGQGNDFIYGAITNLPSFGNEGDDWIELGTQDGAPGDNFDPRGLDTIRGNDVFMGGGGFDEFIGEGGDDIMFGSDGQEKMDGASGFDWATYLQATSGVKVDLSNITTFNRSAPTPSNTALYDLFAFVEGLSGSRFGDVLRGDDMTNADLINNGAQGSVLDQAGINLVAGLQAVVGAGVTTFGGGNIVLGGGGSDIIEGRGGNDIIEGDRYLNVRISVRANIDGTGAEIRTVNSMADLIPDMLSGAINPGQLVIVREILTGSAGVDTAMFSGNRANYTVSVGADGTVVVTDNVGLVNPLGIVIASDGTDTLRGIERLQFADQAVIITPTANAGPVGLLTISDTTPSVGQTLTASAAAVTDANNPGAVATRPIAFTWQFERFPGSGRFEDIVSATGLGGASTAADGVTLTVPSFAAGFNLDGLRLRVRAVYQDATGVLENVFSAPTAAVSGVVAAAPLAAIPVESATETSGLRMIRSDLQFILDQIKIAEAHAGGANLLSLLPNERVPFGLRTVDGSFNNLVPGQEMFGAADQNFPQLLKQNFGNDADGDTFGPVTNTDYARLNATNTAAVSVADADPRIISNLIVDQTVNNPVAYQTAYDAGADGVFSYALTAGADGLLGTADDGLGANGVVGGGDDTDDVLKDGASIINGFRADGSPFQTFQFANVTPDEGLSAPFNEWFVFFGQFFDHGLDLVNKGGNGNVFVPLMPDDPLYVAGSPTNFMVLTRATNTLIQAGADGVFGTSDDRHFQNNQTTPFIDQNQTYTSHPSHQVFLREYVLDGTGRPVATGKLLDHLNTDGSKGGLPTWAEVKAQAQAMLGIMLNDADILNLPMVRTDAYGKFIPNTATGFAEIVTGTGFASGTPAAPVLSSLAIRTNHAFLDDIAHTAAPKFLAGVLNPDADGIVNVAPPPAGTYDNELLNAHFITGDGRGNENIGLTAVHFIFHAEHNRMVEHTKDVVLASNDPAFIAQWQISPGVWNGERLFQAARFATEMQYQHLVFEEFARKVQPMVDLFFAATQVYDTTINPAIVAEFAHVVYRFGHSMLTETVDRFNPNFDANHIGLIQAFLNPLEFLASDQSGVAGNSPAEAAGAIIRGMTRQVGNEIDEMITEALRNNLVGLPLDLAVLNLARGRDTGVPTLNVARAEFYAMTGDPQLAPYTSWVDFAANLKHEAAVINFIAAYGTHASITSATTTEGKRAAAMLLVLGGAGEPADRLAFLSGPAAITGVNAVDFWVGGLAERQMPFGGLLGSSFNFVFENQMEKLQNADRFYYLERTNGLNFLTELENNTFAKLIMANTDATHLPADVFSTPAYTLEVLQSQQFTGLGVTGRDDPTGGTTLVPLVIRDNPATVGPDGNYLQYTGADHVVLGGTAGNDIIISSIGDDSIYGDAGNDRIEGGDGVDQLFGGAGDDIITDLGGDDIIRGGDGNDAIHAGNGINLIIGGAGKDFIMTGEDSSEAFGGTGDDFILGVRPNEVAFGNEGNDWLELGAADGAPGDNFDPLGRDAVIGHDVFFGDSTTDIMNAEGGDDIMMGNGGPLDHYLGLSGYDWASYQHNPGSVVISIDLMSENEAAAVGVNPSILDKFQSVEGISGSAFADILYGSDMLTAGFAVSGFTGSLMTDAGIDLIAGLRALLPGGTPFTGEIILGGGGSDLIRGGWGSEIIDGDKYLSVHLAGVDNSVVPVPFSYDRMEGELARRVFAGEINPGNIHIVREILTAAGGPNFDTVVFSSNLQDYTITTVGDVTTVDSNGGNDGIDILRGVERLQFVDQAVVLGGLNDAPVGLLTVDDPTPTEGQLLTASIAGVTDANNVSLTNPTGAITGPVTYYWQVEATSGSFIDIVLDNGVTKEAAVGPSYRPTNLEVGMQLRVRAVYQDANGVLEQAFSDPTAAVANVNNAPVGTVLVNDITPTATQTLVAVNAFTDPDNDITLPGGGLFQPVYSYQWQQSAVGGGAAFANIAGAINQTFTPTQAGQAGRQLRVVVSYVDGGGTTETVTSAATVVTGNFLTGIVGNFTGNAGEDILTGDGGVNVLSGAGGNDILNGAGGNDTLNGGDGDDTLNGGAGNDIINGDAGNDLINYAVGGGVDTVNGGADVDTLAVTGTGGNDTLVLGSNGTVITTVAGGAVTNVENVTVDLGAGVDRLSYAGNAAAITINLMTGTATGVSSVLNTENSRGGNNNDTLIGDDLANDMEGQAGNDTLTGNGGADVLNGEDNDDTFVATVNDGNDTYGGDAGNDTYDMSGTTAGATVTATSATSTQTGTDVLASIEVYIGGQGGDSITGDASNETLDGRGGNDTLAGLGGADVLIGGLGTDTATYAASAAAVTINLATGAGAGGDAAGDTLSGIENLIGSGLGDTLNASTSGNVIGGSIDGGAGADTLNVTGTAGVDTLDVIYNGTLLTNVEGMTLANIEAVTANLLAANDTLSYLGTTAAVTVNLGTNNASGFAANQAIGIENVVGGSNNDSLTGSTADNVMTGGAGADTINSGAGVDTINGGAGDDIINGGAGSDTAVFSGNFADYTVSVVNGNGTVSGADGLDTLTSIEFLQFAVGGPVFVGNPPPVGTFTIDDTTPAEDQLLTASTAGVTDASNVTLANPTGAVTGPFTFQWQQANNTGAGGGAGGFTNIAGATAASFAPGDAQVNRELKVVVSYTDLSGNVETITSAVTAPVTNVNDAPAGAVTISDTTPQENQLLTATHNITDADGTAAPTVFSFQWQQAVNTGAVAGGFTNIPGADATDATFTPLVAQANRQLRVAVTYTDNQGTTETVFSAATAPNTAAADIGVVLTGDANANTLNGGNGNDTISGLGGNDTLNGNGGADTLNGGAGNDTVNGGAGNDLIQYTVGNGADTINGGTEIDTLAITGLAANETFILAFNGTSITAMGVGAPAGAITNVESLTVDLDGGTDRLSYSTSAAAVTINLTAGTASGNVTSILNVENSRGGAGADTLIGNAGVNDMEGQAGNDILTGMGGNDVLDGEAGNDTFVATLNDGNDAYNGGGNNDTYDLSGTTAGATVTATTSTSAQTGTDTLNSIDRYVGSQGNDTISGDAGNEFFRGEGGADTLNGIGGNDTFEFAAGFGNDTIVGFDAAGGSIANQDMLDIRSFGFTAATFAANVTITDLGNDTLVTIAGNTITLLGVVGQEPNAISITDFILA